MGTDLDKLRQRIGPNVRRLRQQRRWTLAELARRLGTSESRLSEVERGQGSFTAEQLLLVFQIFHVSPGDFVEPDPDRDTASGSLQNALASFGAYHLRQDEAFVILRDHERPVEVVQDVLIRNPVARFVTAVPPVLIRSLADVSFPAVQHAVARAGVPFRWGWLLDQFLAAIGSVESAGASRVWRRDASQARTRAEHFLERLERPAAHTTNDLLDPDLRSARSVKAAQANATEIDRRWHVVSRLTTGDFVPPLEALRDAL